MEDQSSHIWTFELIRPLLLLMVINIHTFLTFYQFDRQPYFYLNYLAVPLFIMMSVFLFQSKIYHHHHISRLTKRLKRFVLPYYFWIIISMLIIPNQISRHNLLFNLLFISVSNIPLYFLSLSSLYAIIQFTINFVSARVSIKVYLFLILLSFGYEIYHLNDAVFHSIKDFSLRMTLMAGIALLKYVSVAGLLFQLQGLIKKHSGKLLAIISPVLILLLLFLHPSTKLDGYSYDGYSLFIEAIAIFLLLIAGKNIDLPTLFQKISKTVNKYALGIFCVHQIIILLTHSFLEPYRFLDNHAFEFLRLLYVLWIYSVGYIICYLLDRFGNNRLKPVVS